MANQLTSGETGVEKYELASDEDSSVLTVAETVRRLARKECGHDVDIQLVDNPRSGKTLVNNFIFDTSKARQWLDWEPECTVEASIQDLLRARADDRLPRERVEKSLD